MTKLYHFSLCIQYIVSFYVNHYLAAAEPLIGEKVVEAKNDEFPSVVSLGVAPGNHVLNHFCTGTLISKKHVLTAGHCLEVNNVTESYMMPEKIMVSVGSIDVTQGTKYKVEEWTNFEEWAAEKRITIYHDKKFYHDIAIVTLADVVENIKPAQLSPSNYKSVYNKTLVAAGWGTTNFNVTPHHLLKADLQVIDRETCSHNLNATDNDPELVAINFCTIAKPPVSLGCGDSGGPVFVNDDEIIGVNIGDCEEHEHPNQQNVHVAVKFYMQFISAILNPKPHCKKRAKIEYTLNGFYDEE